MANTENSKLELLPHQNEAYQAVIKKFEEKGKAAVIFPTGCGKSFVALEYILKHPDERVLFLAPRRAIANQMYEYIVRYIGGDTRSIEEIQKEYGTGNNPSESLKLAARSYIPNIECMLYQMISAYGERQSVDEILNSLKPTMIIVDEMHHLKTKSIRATAGSNVVEDNEEYEEEFSNRIERENKWGKKFKKFLEDNPQAKLLGLSATPIRHDGANVVERIFKDAVASQKSLLEAMEEGQITVDGITRDLPDPYIVIATQNPFGSIGTHSLPESQLDRFMIRTSLGYPDMESEIKMLAQGSVDMTTSGIEEQISVEELRKAREEAARLFVHEDILRYIVEIANETRRSRDLELGISPRGTIALLSMAKANAYLEGRDYVIPQDVKDVFFETIEHRVIRSKEAKVQRKTKEEILKAILYKIPLPKGNQKG